MRLKADLIAEAYKKIGIDALNVGELDLSFSVNYLLAKKKSLGLPFVSSNLVSGDGERTLFSPYIIKEVNGIKVAIFGLLPASVAHDGDIKILPPVDTAKAILKKLKGRADLVILLSNLGQQEDEKLVSVVPGIDVIVGGRTRAHLQFPTKVGNTTILQTAGQGKHIGRLDLNLTEKTFVNNLNAMDDKIPHDEEIGGMVKRYKDAVVNLHSNKPKSMQQEPSLKSYIGESACAVCHPRQSSFWKGTRHATAYETLVKKNSHMDLECIGCHTTGYGMTGGFTLGMMKPDLMNVQCEACHGPGGKHKGRGDIRKMTDASICTGCHDPERDPKFDFNLYIEKVRCPK